MNGNIDEEMLTEIIKQLDNETTNGAVRVSVNYDENQGQGTKVDHSCCSAYGRTANETVGLLDMYSDCMINDDVRK